jgi:hypothetical protein
LVDTYIITHQKNNTPNTQKTAKKKQHSKKTQNNNIQNRHTESHTKKCREQQQYKTQDRAAVEKG